MTRYANQKVAGSRGLFSAALGGAACGAALLAGAIVLLTCAVFFLHNAWLETHLATVAAVVSFGVVMLGAALSGWWLRARGLAVGAVTGIFYAALMAGIGACAAEGELSALLLANQFVLHVMAGALGGVLGVNLAA